MKKELKKTNKPKKSGMTRFCEFGLAMCVIGLICSFFVAIAPVAVAIFGIVLFIGIIIVALFCTVCTFGGIWASDGFKEFMANFWATIEKCFSAPTEILATIKEIYPYIVAVIAAFAIMGFVSNLVVYVKHKDDKTAKKRFITTTVLFSLIIILLILGSVMLYTK